MLIWRPPPSSSSGVCRSPGVEHSARWPRARSRPDDRRPSALVCDSRKVEDLAQDHRHHLAGITPNGSAVRGFAPSVEPRPLPEICFFVHRSQVLTENILRRLAWHTPRSFQDRQCPVSGPGAARRHAGRAHCHDSGHRPLRTQASNRRPAVVSKRQAAAKVAKPLCRQNAICKAIIAAPCVCRASERLSGWFRPIAHGHVLVRHTSS